MDAGINSNKKAKGNINLNIIKITLDLINKYLSTSDIKLTHINNMSGYNKQVSISCIYRINVSTKRYRENV